MGRSRLSGILWSVAAGSFVVLLLIPSSVLAVDTSSSTERVSVSSAGVEGNFQSLTTARNSVSADGRFVVFWSSGTSLVEDDTNQAPDVFVRDRLNGTTVRANVTSTGEQTTATPLYPVNPAISGNGRFVAFWSDAANLVPDDTNDAVDLFVHDLQTGRNERFFAADDPSSNPGYSASTIVLSNDGRFVAYCFEPGDPTDRNFSYDTFVIDRLTGTTDRVTTSIPELGSDDGNSDSCPSSISGDGRFVLLSSESADLVAGDTNGTTDAFVYDREFGSISRVSFNSNGEELNGESYGGSISADGRYVAFSSSASNAVPADTNGVSDIFVRDRVTGQTERVSLDSFGAQANDESMAFSVPSMSSDGRFVTFSSAASNLVAGDSCCWDVFVRDRQTGTTQRVSVASGGGQADGSSLAPELTADGNAVVFYSDATDLVPGDTNGFTDVFVTVLGSSPSSPPTISAFAPAQGSPGTTVIITGSNLLGATRVTFNGKDAASFGVTSATQITAVVPPDATTGPIRIETPGGIVVSALNFTVLQPSTDSDGDGLPDYWELNGVSGPGGSFVNLPGLGADPRHKDIFLWIDSERGAELSPDAEQILVDSFANSPVGGNPDRRTGIRLHINTGVLLSAANSDALKYYGPGGAAKADYPAIFSHWVAESPIAASVYHYAVSVHWNDWFPVTGESSGIPGQLIVLNNCGKRPKKATDDCSASVVDQAANLMHELGHNLGLHHGGDVDVNHKPNYLSVMNYFFSHTGVPGLGITYSRWGPQSLSALDEGSLSEQDGIHVLDGSLAEPVHTKYYCKNGKRVQTVLIGAPIDWNCKRRIEGGRVAADINAEYDTAPLMPYDDWTNLVYQSDNIGKSVIELPPIVPTY
jgi:hypothetical protein